MTIDTRDAAAGCDPRDLLGGRRVPFLSLRANPSHGYAYGLEIMLRHPLGDHWFGWQSYSLQRSVRWTQYALEDESQHVTGQGESYLPFAFDQTHVLNAVANYAFSNVF